VHLFFGIGISSDYRRRFYLHFLKFFREALFFEGILALLKVRFFCKKELLVIFLTYVH